MTAAYPAVRTLAELCLAFGRVPRATRHPDGATETDAEHTVMLGIIACALAARHPELGLAVGRVAEFALVHDFPETYAGDTDSFALGDAARAQKQARERGAQERLAAETAGTPWLCATIAAYERVRPGTWADSPAPTGAPEARFVSYLDKLMPALIHALDGGAGLRARGVALAEVEARNATQRRLLQENYPEFAGVIGPILEAAHADVASRMCATDGAARLLAHVRRGGLRDACAVYAEPQGGMDWALLVGRADGLGRTITVVAHRTLHAGDLRLLPGAHPLTAEQLADAIEDVEAQDLRAGRYGNGS